MGIHFSSFKYKGVDVSQFNGKITWEELAKKVDYVIIRLGYGDTIDPRFIEYITEAIKYDLDIFVYFYGDYYSNWYNKYHPAYGLTDAQWGTRQANNIAKWIGPYSSHVKAVFLDVENTTVINFPKLSDSLGKVHAQSTFKSLLERLDSLSIRNGIYASLGWLSWFSDWFRSRMLWAAFYPYRTADVDVSDLKYMVAKNGWKVEPIIWQYAQDGDQDDNGTKDGITYFGTSGSNLDLNGWIGTDDQYTDLFGAPVVVVPEETNQSGVYEVTANPYLFIRQKPSADTTSKKLGLYYPGTRVHISNITGNWGEIEEQESYIYLGNTKKV